MHLKRLEFIPPRRVESPVAAPERHPPVPLTTFGTEKKSLRAMEFGAARNEDSLKLFSAVPTSHRTANAQRSDGAPKKNAAADFLHAVRSKTLLDYKFMREFSLAKKKPIPERNMSKMSAASVYSVRMAQLALEQQHQRLMEKKMAMERIKSDVDKLADMDGDRAQTHVAAAEPSSSTEPSKRQGISFRRRALRKPPLATVAAPPQAETRTEPTAAVNVAAVTEHDVVEEEEQSTFPTLWKGDISRSEFARSTVAVVPHRPSNKGLQRQFTMAGDHNHGRMTPSLLTGTKRRPTVTAMSDRHGKPLSPNSLQNGMLLWQDLSDFDLRKCHPTSVVTAQHGFLREQDIPALTESTGYSRVELYALWTRFKALCSIAKSPKGIDKDTFRRGIPQLSVEDQFFIDRVFDILDADGSGILEWKEFVEALSSMEKGDVRKRVELLFRVYDLNGDNTIHRNEIVQFVLASLLVRVTDDLEEVARHFVDKIFVTLGCEDKDVVRVDDVTSYMVKNPSTDVYALFGRTMITNRTVGVSIVHTPRSGATHAELPISEADERPGS
ncbi:TPA: hypothetical protein N0F65_002790 [Lagenidium giganteum]|uniref:EF-hand domain-containing protein n=1 Tax=Lagenidium giganteum TaxID=4803 RepID=A0AAV2YLN7_9STRA|nr:TPA: hypothetical protein N0F65_002790 [Lagenidium giganteum]